MLRLCVSFIVVVFISHCKTRNYNTPVSQTSQDNRSESVQSDYDSRIVIENPVHKTVNVLGRQIESFTGQWQGKRAMKAHLGPRGSQGPRRLAYVKLDPVGSRASAVEACEAFTPKGAWRLMSRGDAVSLLQMMDNPGGFYNSTVPIAEGQTFSKTADWYPFWTSDGEQHQVALGDGVDNFVSVTSILETYPTFNERYLQTLYRTPAYCISGRM